MKSAITAAACLFLCACGPGVEVKGFVGGKGFAAKQATVTTEHPPLSPDVSFVTLWIANRDQLCGYLGGTLYMNYTDLLIVDVGKLTATGQLNPPTPGTYPITELSADAPPPPGNFAGVHYYAIDCRVRFQSVARGGTLTLTSVDRDGDGRYSLEGGFSADFGASGSFSASFSADACSNPVNFQIPISNCP